MTDDTIRERRRWFDILTWPSSENDEVTYTWLSAHADSHADQGSE